MKRNPILKEHLYQRIAQGIEQQIKNKVLVMGEKLPSLRSLCNMHGISQSTAIKIYYELEGKGLVEARPQSGYFVCGSFKELLPLPQTSQPDGENGTIPIEDIVEKVFSSYQHNYITLCEGVPPDALLPIAKLNKAMIQAMRQLKDSGTGYGDSQGNEKLRRQITRHAFFIPNIKYDDIITTTGCINAISYAMMSLTKPGDVIAVESPVYFGILQLAKSLRLQVLELPTHPETGIEIEALKTALQKHKVKLCLLVSNFSNPIGSLMPDEHKKEVVRLIQKFKIPLIEDDIYGDVYFGGRRPATCKSFDDSGLVLWCSSVSKTLAPGYRVGWIEAGNFKREILRIKRFNSISSTNITQEVIANFLENGRYEHHLRKLRNALQISSLNYIRAIQEYFPSGTKISRPQGGFVLWIELDKKVNSIALHEQALRRGISIAPGRMFTLQEQYNNCIRINYAMQWNDKLEWAFKTLGDIAKGLIVQQV